MRSLEIKSLSAGPSLMLFVFGLVCLYTGSSGAVAGGIALAQLWQVPERVIGLTVIAGATALPTMAATFVAAARAQAVVAISDVVSVNIFNLFVVTGLVAVTHPAMLERFSMPDDLIALAASACVVPLLLAARWTLTRGQGVALIVAYLGYVGFVLYRSGLIAGMHLPLG